MKNVLEKTLNLTCSFYSQFCPQYFRSSTPLLYFSTISFSTQLSCFTTHNMAQSANDVLRTNAKSPVDIEMYWPSTHYSPDPPRDWHTWLEGFKIALFVKHSLDYDTLLTDPTDAVPPPRFTSSPAGETDEARETRMAANRKAQADYQTSRAAAWEAPYNGTTRR